MKIHELLYESLAATVDTKVDSVPELGKSRQGMHYKDVTVRVPELTAAAKKVEAGEMDWEEYQALVNKHKRVDPYTSVPKPASTAAMKRGLAANKVGKLNTPLEDGVFAQLRLDIPAYKDKGVWIPTVHDASGTSVRHGSTSIINDVTIRLPQKGALGIATGKTSKVPIATLKGTWENATPKEAYRLANAAMHDPAWVQIGMDPERHAYFYDRATQEPVIGGDRVIQVAGLVMLKNPTYGKKSDFIYEAGMTELFKDLDEEIFNELTFHGRQCTKDCSGHTAGYQYQKKFKKNPPSHSPHSPSFNGGVAVAVNHDEKGINTISTGVRGDKGKFVKYTGSQRFPK